jgi:hypothetical protein
VPKFYLGNQNARNAIPVYWVIRFRSRILGQKMEAKPRPADPDSRRRRSPTSKQGWAAAVTRIGRIVLISGLVVLSLLTFPAAIPWMVALWLAWHTWSAARSRLAWLPLVACAAILLVKRTAWPPGLKSKNRGFA